MEKITLSENHKRSLSSAIHLVEKLTIEIESELTRPTDLIMTRVVREGVDNDLQSKLSAINDIKKYIKYMAEKYNPKPVSLNQNNVIRAKKTKMWEILCDSTSRGLRGGGRFPEEFAREFDKDIDDLQEIIKRI